MYNLVDTEAKLAELLDFISRNEMLAYDIETTGLNPRKDVIIGFGISNAQCGYYLPVYSYDLQSSSLRELPNSKRFAQAALVALSFRKVLMFNASFDARFTKNYFGVDLLQVLHADVLLLKHTCDEDFPLDLKGIAAKLFGADVKEEKLQMQASIKANGGTSTQYFKANTELMARYCIQDCVLTFKIYNYYLPVLEKQRLSKFYFEDEVLPLYKEVTIPMEETGVRLDMAKLLSVHAEISSDIAALEAEIQEAIKPYLGIFTSWFLKKEYPSTTPTGKLAAWTKKHKFAEQAWRADNPTGYMFNLQSKHHLKKLFFDSLKEEPVSTTPTGQPQVNEDFLDSMAIKYPWAAKLVEYNKLTKLCGTYIERFINESENGRFYPAFQQHRTVSGRYAGDLQQLPRPLESSQSTPLIVKYTNCIREFVISDEGSYLVSADYEQLEPSVFAHVSGDAALQAIFCRGVDFYSEVAIRTESLRGVSSDKNSPEYLGRKNKAARQKAKAYALGIAYGMTGYKLKFEIGTDEETANALVQDYLNAFPKLAEWMIASKRVAKEQGLIRTQAGRVRHLGEAKRIYAKWGAIIEDDLALWKALHEQPWVYAEAKEDRKTFKNAMNNAINFQIQGLAASIVNRASINLSRLFKAQKMQTKVVAQIHDELVFSVPEAELEAANALIKDVMEGIVKLAVPLRTQPQAGRNFKQCK